MPRCYFVNDARRALPPAAARRDAGLPDDALVFACLNQSYKLSARVFAIWMDAMAHVPNVVLWLLSPGARARANLQADAARAGVDPARLIFAPHLQQEAHIARLRCADLALDTLPYGSHTTGCDALWAGVPLLTCPGQTFASRVGASLLHTAGLPQLVAASLDDYRARLRELASVPEALREHRAFLERTRYDNPLFDTRGFARDWKRCSNAPPKARSRPADRWAGGERVDQAVARLRSINSILYPSGSCTKAMTVVPPFTGPASRVTFAPKAPAASRTLAHAAEQPTEPCGIRGLRARVVGDRAGGEEQSQHRADAVERGRDAGVYFCSGRSVVRRTSIPMTFV